MQKHITTGNTVRQFDGKTFTKVFVATYERVAKLESKKYKKYKGTLTRIVYNKRSGLWEIYLYVKRRRSF